MKITRAYFDFRERLDELSEKVEYCRMLLLHEDEYFTEPPLHDNTNFIRDNTNFLTKSFLITLCSYLEVYCKDVLEILLNDYDSIIRAHKLPHNLILWSLNEKKKADSKVNALLDKRHFKFEDLKIKLKRDDLDAFISGSPERTNNLFKMFGIQLDKECQSFKEFKDQIRSVVMTRNRILHHNDNASNVSNSDVLGYIDLFMEYALGIDKIIEPKITNQEYIVC